MTQDALSQVEHKKQFTFESASRALGIFWTLVAGVGLALPFILFSDSKFMSFFDFAKRDSQLLLFLLYMCVVFFLSRKYLGCLVFIILCLNVIHSDIRNMIVENGGNRFLSIKSFSRESLGPLADHIGMKIQFGYGAYVIGIGMFLTLLFTVIASYSRRFEAR